MRVTISIRRDALHVSHGQLISADGTSDGADFLLHAVHNQRNGVDQRFADTSKQPGKIVQAFHNAA